MSRPATWRSASWTSPAARCEKTYGAERAPAGGPLRVARVLVGWGSSNAASKAAPSTANPLSCGRSRAALTDVTIAAVAEAGKLTSRAVARPGRSEAPHRREPHAASAAAPALARARPAVEVAGCRLLPGPARRPDPGIRVALFASRSAEGTPSPAPTPLRRRDRRSPRSTVAHSSRVARAVGATRPCTRPPRRPPALHCPQSRDRPRKTRAPP